MLASSTQGSENKNLISLSLGELKVSFPPEVIQVNSKQII